MEMVVLETVQCETYRFITYRDCFPCDGQPTLAVAYHSVLYSDPIGCDVSQGFPWIAAGSDDLHPVTRTHSVHWA